MNQKLTGLLKKLKSLIFERYILLILVPAGFIFDFLVTAPFIIMCSLENLSRKKNKN